MRLMSSKPKQCFCWSCAKEVRIGNNYDEVDCVYCVEGPSALLTSETALDVLAVAQHLLSMEVTDGTNSDETSLTLASLNGKNANPKRVKRGGIRALKDATVATLLKDFGAVVKSHSFKASVELNNSTADEVEPQIMLLQMCLEVFQETDGRNLS